MPHGVNLVIEHTSDASPLISKVFDTMQSIYVFFSKSTNRHAELNHAIGKIENTLKLRSLSQTRWSARPESIEAVWRSLDIIVEVLHLSEENGDTEAKRKAAILINLVVNIDFICGIMLLKHIMYKTKFLSDFLQGESIDMAAAMVVMQSTLKILEDISSRETELNNEIEAAIAVAKSQGANPQADFIRSHRTRMPSTSITFHSSNMESMEMLKLKLYYRTQFYAFMDTLGCELKDKLKLVKVTFNDFLLALNPDNPGPPEATARLIASFPALFSEESSSGIHNELKIFSLHLKKEIEDCSRGELSTSSAGYLALELARRHSHQDYCKSISVVLICSTVCVQKRKKFQCTKISKKLPS